MNFLSLIKRKILFKLKKKISIDKEILLNKNLDELFYHYGSDKAENVRRTGKKVMDIQSITTITLRKLKIIK